MAYDVFFLKSMNVSKNITLKVVKRTKFKNKNIIAFQ